MYISTKKIEKAFGRKIIPFITCLGVDTASRTGWCKVTPTKDRVEFDYGFVDLKSKDKYFKYDQFIEIFNTFVKADKVVIEESFMSRNVKTFQMLSRLGGFVYVLAKLHGVKDVRFLLATSARKFLDMKGNAKKQIIQEEFKKRLSLKLNDEDIIDAMVLALNGVME